MTVKTNHAFNRLELLTGSAGLEALRKTSVALFGIGGVGSWCAESLIRSGIGHLTIVDSDLICVTNINRQLQATHDTVGASKVDVLKQRLASINPHAEIIALQKVYNRTTASSFPMDSYDYVIDAIDSLSSKVELIIHASHAGTKTYSALGASCKLDPTRIRVASLWETHGCPLGHFVRKRLRKRKFSGEVTCVFSDEMLPNYDIKPGCGTGKCICPTVSKNGDPVHEWCSSKKQINGSVAHITGIYGFMLAGLVIQDVLEK